MPKLQRKSAAARASALPEAASAEGATGTADDPDAAPGGGRDASGFEKRGEEERAVPGTGAGVEGLFAPSGPSGTPADGGGSGEAMEEEEECSIPAAGKCEWTPLLFPSFAVILEEESVGLRADDPCGAIRFRVTSCGLEMLWRLIRTVGWATTTPPFAPSVAWGKRCGGPGS